MDALTAELRKFVVDNFVFEENSGEFCLSDDDSFIERGIVDSTGILELVLILEETYGIAVADHELVPENLDSLARLASFVQRKLVLTAP